MTGPRRLLSLRGAGAHRPRAGPDYPYSLVGRELRSIIRALLGRAAGVLELFFDHCIYTMLQELDKTPGEARRLRAPPRAGLVLPGAPALGFSGRGDAAAAPWQV